MLVVVDLRRRDYKCYQRFILSIFNRDFITVPIVVNNIYIVYTTYMTNRYIVTYVLECQIVLGYTFVTPKPNEKKIIAFHRLLEQIQYIGTLLLHFV